MPPEQPAPPPPPPEAAGDGMPLGLRIAVVEDDPLLRHLLLKLLRSQFRPADLREFSRGKPCLEGCLREPPDLLLVDLRLPDLDGRGIIRALRAAGARTRVIVLTSMVDSMLPSELVALGGAGLVDKAAPLDNLERAVASIIQGGMYFASNVAPEVSPMAVALSSNTATPAVLTDREREVARLVAAGLSSKEIASRLDLSVRTVENHRANILDKLGLRDTPALIRWCLHVGLS